MMRRVTAPLFIPTLLLVVAIIGLACGGDGELTLEEYFGQVEALDEETEAQTEALGFPEEQEFASEEQIEAFRDFFEGSVRFLSTFKTSLQDIDPPAAVEVDHNEVLDAGGKFVNLLQGVQVRLADVESTSELEALFEEKDPEIEAARDRFDQACLDLEEIAQANGIVVNLRCEG